MTGYETQARTSRWISVVFVQGADARSVLSMLEHRGAAAAIEYLRNWDHGKWTTAAAQNDGYGYDRIPAGSSDHTVENDGSPYALTYSTTSGYVSLLRRHPPESELQVVWASRASARQAPAETWTARDDYRSPTVAQHSVSL